MANITSPAGHPYYPLGIEVVGYLANEYSVLTLLVCFAIGCAVILGSTLLAVNEVRPGLPLAEKTTVWWFVLCELSYVDPTTRMRQVALS